MSADRCTYRDVKGDQYSIETKRDGDRYPRHELEATDFALLARAAALDLLALLEHMTHDVFLRLCHGRLVLVIIGHL